MSAMNLILLLTCLALVSGANINSEAAARAEAEAEAEAEAAGAAEIQRALGALQAALTEGQHPWSRRLEVAQESLAPLLAALEAHTATVLLHSRSKLDRLQPAIKERLEAAQALLTQTQQELVKGAAERSSEALAQAQTAVLQAGEYLAGALMGIQTIASSQNNESTFVEH